MLAPSITATMLDEGLKQDAWKYTFKAAKVLIVVCLFTSACTLWIGQWAIGLLFQWGVFGTSDTQAVTIMLTILLIGAGPMLASAVAFRVLQNTGNSLHIAYLSFTWVILYALFAKLFNVRFGNLSLSIAYVVTWSLIALAAYILLARNLKSAD